MANQVDYFEIGSSDPASSRAFYGGLFEWSIGEPSLPAQYSAVEQDKGGLWDTTGMGAENWAIFYVHVENVQTTIDRAQELGATVVIPLVDNGAIEFAHLIDPQGNRFGIWRPKDE
jgi:predicted enzyme related to lactoylglutathione lyase